MHLLDVLKDSLPSKKDHKGGSPSRHGYGMGDDFGEARARLLLRSKEGRG